MRNLRFHKPVVLSLRFGHYRSVRTVAEAGRVLLHEWPEGENQKCNRAARLVIEALRGERKPSEVRNALIEAAEASGILVDDGHNQHIQIAAE
jgi:hypothetical protein